MNRSIGMKARPVALVGAEYARSGDRLDAARLTDCPSKNWLPRHPYATFSPAVVKKKAPSQGGEELAPVPIVRIGPGCLVAPFRIPVFERQQHNMNREYLDATNIAHAHEFIVKRSDERHCFTPVRCGKNAVSQCPSRATARLSASMAVRSSGESGT